MGLLRRQFLLTSAAAATAVFAGCTSTSFSARRRTGRRAGTLVVPLTNSQQGNRSDARHGDRKSDGGQRSGQDADARTPRGDGEVQSGADRGRRDARWRGPQTERARRARRVRGQGQDGRARSVSERQRTRGGLLDLEGGEPRRGDRLGEALPEPNARPVRDRNSRALRDGGFCLRKLNSPALDRHLLRTPPHLTGGGRANCQTCPRIGPFQRVAAPKASDLNPARRVRGGGAELAIEGVGHMGRSLLLGDGDHYSGASDNRKGNASVLRFMQ